MLDGGNSNGRGPSTECGISPVRNRGECGFSGGRKGGSLGFSGTSGEQLIHGVPSVVLAVLICGTSSRAARMFARTMLVTRTVLVPRIARRASTHARRLHYGNYLSQSAEPRVQRGSNVIRESARTSLSCWRWPLWYSRSAFSPRATREPRPPRATGAAIPALLRRDACAVSRWRSCASPRTAEPCSRSGLSPHAEATHTDHSEDVKTW